MMMIQYLLDVGEEVHIPDIKSQETTYADGVAPVKMALEQEKRVSEEIFALFELAREVKDYRAEQFMQWFVKEQVEEVALMSDLLNVVERSKDNLLLAEDYIARESLGRRGLGPDRAAGGWREADQPSQPARLCMLLMRRNSAMSSRRAAGAGAGRKRAGSGDSTTPVSALVTR